MSQVFRQKPLAPDQLLGRVEPDGKVYESRFGPDKHVGRVDLATGKIYEQRLGPDKYVGHIHLENGKIYRQKPLAPDEYLGHATAEGKLFRHKALAADEYLGKIASPGNYALAGAAFFLLLLPAWEETQADDQPENTPPTEKK